MPATHLPTPDDDQREVIAIASGRHLVLAPPGCGKTFILTERVIKAHEEGVDYADMICLTFTNRASRGMRDRIAERTGNPVPPSLFVGNVHRFCSQYLFDQKKIAQNSAIIDDIDTESIISYLAGLDDGSDRGRLAQEIVNLQHALSQQEQGFPRELIVHADLLDTAQNPEMQHKVALARLYGEYKATDNLVDFEDLLEKTYSYALQERDSLKRYKWIQIDEVQDLNLLQLAIVDLFAAPDATIVYLGDDQQAIFSFVGAKLVTLDHLRQLCAGRIHHLGTNHRSPRYLLDIFNSYAQRQLGIDPSLLPVTADSSTPAPEDLCLFRACHHSLQAVRSNAQALCPADRQPCERCTRPVADEYRLAVRLAMRYASLDDEGRVAVIVPTNNDADLISKAFGTTEHFKISGLDLFSTPSVQAVLSHFNIVANETCFIAWARLLYLLKVVKSYSTARNLMREFRNRAITPTDLLLYEGTDTYLQHFLTECSGGTLVLFDTETTGLDTFNDDIIQIAAVKVRDGHIVEGSEFEVVIDTDKELPPVVGGHENPMIGVYNNARRLPRAEALRRFLDYCGDSVLVGHNVEFDYHILLSNLERASIPAGRLSATRFDTLKLTRLVEPRLRVYKLERLLETLHLEGCNSHNAIDDVKATFSLLSYCTGKARTLVDGQRALLAQQPMRDMAALFRQRYLPIYLHTTSRLYLRAEPQQQPALVQEMQHTYLSLLAANLIKPVDKWPRIVDYLSVDMISQSLCPSLKEQLDKYIVEINTTRESDLCDSTSMRQGDNRVRFFVTTAHKAKGLEFENVIVFNAADGYYPFFNNVRTGDTEHLQEDARRFYVALSRAKRRLCITWGATDNRGRPAKPSPFLQAIADMLATYAYDPTAQATVRVESLTN